MVAQQYALEPDGMVRPSVTPSLRQGGLTPIDLLVDRLWLVHTKPRNEKALAADLEARGIRYYLPLVRLRRSSGGRVWWAEIPLFAGYMFLCGGESERYATLTTHRTVNVIHVADQARLREDLRHIYHVTASEEHVELYPGLRRGRRCRVRRGSLAGVEGVVLERRSMHRVYIGVEILGQSAEVEIDPALLEVIE